MVLWLFDFSGSVAPVYLFKSQNYPYTLYGVGTWDLGCLGRLPTGWHRVLKATVKTRLFIKPYCPWCHKAMTWLDERGIEYEQIDVIADEAAFEEMIRLSGQELAPVIDVDGKVLADFGPEELERFWKSL